MKACKTALHVVALFIKLHSPSLISLFLIGSLTTAAYAGGSMVTVGSPGFGSSPSYYPYIDFDNTGTPYVSNRVINSPNTYIDIYKFDGNDWVTVGPQLIINSTITKYKFAVSPGGQPYIVYENGSGTYAVHAKRLNGNTWENVGGGTGQVSQAVAYKPDIKIADNGTVFVSYMDHSNYYHTGPSVKKFNGSSWSYVGQQNFVSQSIIYLDLAVDSSGTPYVVLEDCNICANCCLPRLLKFDGSIWRYQGNSAGAQSYHDFDVYVPNKAYTTHTNWIYSHVKEWEGGSWNSTGTSNMTGYSQEKIVADQNGLPWWLIKKGAYELYYYDDNNWTQKATFSANVGEHDIGYDRVNGIFYMVYRDIDQGSKVTVLKYDCQFLADTIPVDTLTDLNDYCSAPMEWSNDAFAADGTKGSCHDNGPNNTRWFAFQATTSDIHIKVKTGPGFGGLKYGFAALFNECGDELDCYRYASPSDSLELISTSLVPGNWYFFSVDNYTGINYSGSFTLCISDVINYNYNNHDGAQVLSDLNSWCSANAEYTTIGATGDESKGSCHDNGPNYNRWFKFQATTNDIQIDFKTGGAEGTLKYPFVALWDEAGTELNCQRYTETYDDMLIQQTGLTIGNWYYISVDNYFGPQYTGTFSLCIDDALTYDYDDWNGALTLAHNSGCSADAAYSTHEATGDQSKGSCHDNGPNYNRWFKFQATTSNVQIDYKTGGSEGSMRYPFLALWNDSGGELDCQSYTQAYDDMQIRYSGLTIGNWYYISVDNYYGPNYVGSFSLCVDDVFSYDYDNKAGATVLTNFNNWCSVDAIYSTVDATPDENAGSCWYNGPSYNRWFQFTAPAGGTVEIEMKTGGSRGTMRYPFMALWDAGGTEIGCDVYSSPYDTLNIFANTLTPGNTYYISVDNYEGVNYQGAFTLCINGNFDNDFRAGATLLSNTNNFCSADAAYSTIGATTDEAKPSCWDNGPNYNRWFRFSGPASGNVDVTVQTGGSKGSMRYTFLALYDNSMTELDCGRYVTIQGNLSVTATGLTPGNNYYVEVDNYVGVNYRGSFTICIDDDGVPKGMSEAEQEINEEIIQDQTAFQGFINRTLQIFPNPSAGNIFIRMEDIGKAQTEIGLEILNLHGQTVFKAMQFSLSAGQSKKLELGDLPKGIYFVVIEKYGNRVARKLILQ